MDTIDILQGSDKDRSIILLLNEKIVGGVFNPYALILSSLFKKINCEILTCSCGVAGCAGIFEGTTVKQRKHTVEWRDIDCGLPKRFYSFQRDNYLSEINKLKIMLLSDGENVDESIKWMYNYYKKSN